MQQNPQNSLPEGFYRADAPMTAESFVVQVYTGEQGQKRVWNLEASTREHGRITNSPLADWLIDGYAFCLLIAVHPSLHEGLAAALHALSAYVAETGFLPGKQDAASKGLLALASMLNVPEIIRAYEGVAESMPKDAEPRSQRQETETSREAWKPLSSEQVNNFFRMTNQGDVNLPAHWRVFMNTGTAPEQAFIQPDGSYTGPWTDESIQAHLIQALGPQAQGWQRLAMFKLCQHIRGDVLQDMLWRVEQVKKDAQEPLERYKAILEYIALRPHLSVEMEDFFTWEGQTHDHL